MTKRRMCRERFTLRLILLLLLAACGAQGNPHLPVERKAHRGVADPAYSAAIAVAESLAATLTAASPAISAAVAVGDSVVWSAAFGFSNLAAKTVATPDSRFRIYSLSKGLTATTALWLRDKGRLDLDVPISSYIASGPITRATARQLLGHIGGVRHYKGSEAIATRTCARPIDALEIFGKDAPLSPPGTAYLYSSWGYATLSAVIESAGAAPFDSAVTHAVLAPAVMRSTGLPVSSGLLPGEVTPYEASGKSVKPAREVNNRCKWGGGAFVSTAEDMARFGSALLGGRLIPDAEVEELFTAMKTADGKSTEYGMGFGVSTDSTGMRRITHSGSAMGGRSAIVMLPSLRIVVVILSNVEGDRLVQPALDIAKAFAR